LHIGGNPNLFVDCGSVFVIFNDFEITVVIVESYLLSGKTILAEDLKTPIAFVTL